MLQSAQACLRFSAIFLTFLVAAPAESFTVPLPEESVRDAYFLGQRRAGPAEDYLARYQKNLPAPVSGPWISSVRFLTPFAQLVSYSSKQMNYNAQQALIDHRGKPETVSIEIVIRLTNPYPAIVEQPTESRLGSPSGSTIRASDFWKAFRAQVSVGDKIVEPADFTGEPNLICGEYDCTLIGATLYMTFPAESLNADFVTVRVLPPEGSGVSAEFATAQLR
jgi:hypothetical protein